MKEIGKEEMKEVEGGGGGIILTSALTALIVFVVGILHGYCNPKTCNQ